jgi:hypothetical protein
MGHGHGFAEGVIYPEVEPPPSTMVDKVQASGPPFAAEDVAPTRKVLAQHIITMPKWAARLPRTTNARASSTACRAAKGIAADQTRNRHRSQKTGLELGRLRHPWYDYTAFSISRHSWLGFLALIYHAASASWRQGSCTYRQEREARRGRGPRWLRSVVG